MPRQKKNKTTEEKHEEKQDLSEVLDEILNEPARAPHLRSGKIEQSVGKEKKKPAQKRKRKSDSDAEKVFEPTIERVVFDSASESPKPCDTFFDEPFNWFEYKTSDYFDLNYGQFRVVILEKL